jgi:putative inorganic carbon (HCO3(-)) transporter
MHFGLEPYVGYTLYICFVAVVLLTVFWRPITGIFFLLPIIPLQTIRYRVNDFPLGASLLGVVLLAVGLGLMRRGQPVWPKTQWTNLLGTYVAFTFVSLCLGSLYLGQSSLFPSPERFGMWREYMIMPTLLLLTVAASPTRRQMKAMILVMCLATLALDHNFWNFVSEKDFSAFSDDLRDASSMGYAGSNGLAAFGAQATALLLALAAFERKVLLSIGYRALAVFTIICVMYSFSRGGYLAVLVGCVFIGVVRQRSLLILLLVFAWAGTSLVPKVVQQRVSMTYDEQSGSLDHSANTRLTLWEDAMQVFHTNPVIGTGFDTYAYLHRVGDYQDTHNFFLKVLFETGIVGMVIFLWLLAKAFGTGFALFRHAKDPFLASLGLGLAAWVVCSIVANCFGDRWTYVQVNGYMWVLGGLVSRGLALEESGEPLVSVGNDAVGAPTEVSEDLNPQPA